VKYFSVFEKLFRDFILKELFTLMLLAVHCLVLVVMKMVSLGSVFGKCLVILVEKLENNSNLFLSDLVLQFWYLNLVL
jgi:hypothetical protein